MVFGVDGHTAGIMPYPNEPDRFEQLFVKGKSRYIAYDAGNKNEFPERVTPNIPFLTSKIDYCFAYVVGEEKKKIVRTLYTQNVSLNNMQSQILRQIKNSELFTDIIVK